MLYYDENDSGLDNLYVNIDGVAAGNFTPGSEVFRDYLEYNSFIGALRLDSVILNGF